MVSRPSFGGWSNEADEVSNLRSGVPKPASGWSRWLPGLATLRCYEPAWLAHDVIAGLVLATMLAPVGIANCRKRKAGSGSRGGSAFSP